MTKPVKIQKFDISFDLINNLRNKKERTKICNFPVPIKM